MRFHNDPGNYVAHYTRMGTAVDHILRNRTLRIGPLISTNDPRETMTWHFSVGAGISQDSPSSQDLKALSKRNNDFNRILRHGYKVLCVSQDAEGAGKLDFSDRSYGKPRMWSQYGENHRGICLLFDKQVLHETISNKFGCQSVSCGTVKYGDFHNKVGTKEWAEHVDAFTLSGDDLVKNGLESTLQHHREKYHDVFFFRKNEDWEQEAEYRWIIRGDNNDPEFVPIEESLRAILLGVDFPIDRLAEVHKYCKDTDTCLSRILWSNGMPIVQWFDAKHLDSKKYRNVLEYHALLTSC